MHWLWVFIVGLVVGLLAKAIMPGKDPGGFIITGLLGIAGSVISTYIGEQLGWWPATGFVHFLGSIAGAIVLLLLYHFLFKRKAAA
ncbi:GlsB/YeaQ/YmgE family stress response membrane protein [Dyella sp. BiH032]|uniref:GlsB/YeaQ/YmgE family stress response membrane protein n=1 Tax=Dyella sp. BiH032 TaxID=3075430 RepID=UPI0028930E6A|nr:GlsB/YeaQ/YmgE family stress response membrane protein [Dyella sp. BiH032]WNL45031.1 GlsB/YeaQ/YmgE family stress response membrane protein [Dyella sp. BiH032]